MCVFHRRFEVAIFNLRAFVEQHHQEVFVHSWNYSPKKIHSFGMHLFTHVQNHIIVDSPVCVNITIHSPVIALACYNVALAFRISNHLDEYSAELVTAAAMDKDKRAENESES